MPSNISTHNRPAKLDGSLWLGKLHPTLSEDSIIIKGRPYVPNAMGSIHVGGRDYRLAAWINEGSIDLALGEEIKA